MTHPVVERVNVNANTVPPVFRCPSCGITGTLAHLRRIRCPKAPAEPASKGPERKPTLLERAVAVIGGILFG